MRIVLFQGVESVMCASYKAALEAGHPVKIEVDQSMTLADGNSCFFVFCFYTNENSFSTSILNFCYHNL